MQILELPKSKLRLDSEELVKSGPGDAVVARYPTDHIERIALEKTLSSCGRNAGGLLRF